MLMQKIKLTGSRKIKLYGVLIIAFFIVFMQNANVIAATGVKIYNYTSKKEYTYTDRQIKVTYNGKAISVDSTPGLLDSGIALVSYKDIFAKSDIKADCVYDKDAATVSVSKFGITIVMKIGSKTAYVNGKEMSMSVAPVKIKYLNDDVTKILVPSRFVCENLGFDYTWNKDTNTVAIVGEEAPIFLSYNDDDPFYYTGTQAIVNIDGNKIDLGKMPTIITNNIAMVRAKRVFSDSIIKADYKYSAKDKTVTLSRNGNLLQMKIGSPVAYLNDKAIVLDTAPMIVTNHDIGTSYVLVPGSFTASCLGFDYNWDKANKTSFILSRDDELIDNFDEEVDIEAPEQTPDNAPDQTQENAPELGDSAVSWDKGTIVHQWEANKDLIGFEKNIHSIDNQSFDNNQIGDTLGTIFNISKDYINPKLNTETFAIISNKPFGKVTSEAIGRQVKLHAFDMACVSNTYNMRLENAGLLDNIRLFAENSTNSTIEFNFVTDKYTYDLSLSENKQILYITIYYNTLNKVTIGTNNTMDYITLTGRMPLDVIINKIPGLITIQLPNTKKGIEDAYTNLNNANKLYFASAYYGLDGTNVILGLNDDVDYYIVENGNNYTIMLPHNNVTPPFIPNAPERPDYMETPVTPAVPTPTVPETPISPSDNKYPVGEMSRYEIRIPNPAAITTSQIKDEDQYSKNRFSICIPGDYVSYFAQNPITVSSNIISDISVFLNSNYETEILVSTSKLQGYEICADSEYIYVNVGNPREIYKNIVVLDPGHGGPAPGAHYFKTYEKNINLKILYEIGKDFFNSNTSELKVYYTRESDVDLTLSNRAAFAKEVGADLFVSLHMNANTQSSVYGTEIYYSNNNNKKNNAGLNSEMLSKIFVDNLSKSLGTKNRGVRAEKYTVVHKNTVPAVLIELGFMSNANDFAKISDPSFQYEAAKVIYQTLLQVFKAYPTDR